MNKYYWDMLYSESHLEHHGVQGQKWGVTNGPPYPLGRDVFDLLSSRDANNTKILKALKSEYKNSNGAYSKEAYRDDVRIVKKDAEYKRMGVNEQTRQALLSIEKNKRSPNSSDNSESKTDDKASKQKEILDNIDKSSEDIKACASAFEKWTNAFDNQTDYLDTPQADADRDKAWNDTKTYMEKYYKKEYDEIVTAAKRDYGDKYEQNLDRYHDFRKMYDGFLDQALTEGEQRYMKENPDYKAQVDAVQKAEKDYKAAVGRATNNIVNSGDNSKYINYKDVYQKVQQLSH